jgi:alkyl sulfatase BDS1-like metallo-beta-lactamase superfamily hydrolase
VDDILDLADRLWRGEADVEHHHPVRFNGGLSEITDGVAFLASFSRVSAFDTDDGLVLVDTGHVFAAEGIHRDIRSWTKSRLNTAVFSHGHVDHVFGVGVFEQESSANRWPAPTVIAHEAMPARFDRYILTAGFNAIINQRQFQVPGLTWPTEYRYPDTTYSQAHTLEVGGLTAELHHARGETDDHTWTWFPSKKILCTGDLFIWASPNAGNPQKVQRYPREWAIALREMDGLGAEVLLPGHGYPVIGADRVHRALTDTALLLETLVTQALDMMNAGARLDEMLHSVEMPADLLDRPYLRPIYDDPEFVLRNIWRQYGGWYDGNPARLKPAPDAVVASELAQLAGGVGPLVARARELLASGGPDELRLAGHLVEYAFLAAPEDGDVNRARAEVFEARVGAEPSTMAQGIFAWAASESRRQLDG